MRTNNTTIFTQEKYDIDTNMAIESACGYPIFWFKYSKSERKVKGFKFGFVVTKLRKHGDS